MSDISEMGIWLQGPTDGTLVLTPVNPETPVGEIDFDAIVRTADGAIVAVSFHPADRPSDGEGEDG
ncbi:MAG TPA: hypothetical protein EYP77_06430 [Anaerolineae bacterium]|nr:hypothetical protein [Anaerolineae bacterium]